MPKQPKEKSAHLQELEAVFERHTRRFSPFDVLGLRASEQDTADPPQEAQDENISTHRGVDDTHPHDTPIHMGEGDTPLSEEGIHPRVGGVKDRSLTPTENNISTHRGVDDTHPHDTPIHMGEGDTPLSEEGIHPRVGGVKDRSLTPTENNISTH